MSFQSTTLSVELNDLDTSRFLKFRVKLHKHPLESEDHFTVRSLAVATAYSADLNFSTDQLLASEATLVNRDVTGELISWVHVGVPGTKLLKTLKNEAALNKGEVYIYSEEQLSELKNLKVKLNFFQIDSEFVARLTELQNSSPVWNITIVDNQLYISSAGNELQTEFIKQQAF